VEFYYFLLTIIWYISKMVCSSSDV